MRRGGRPFDTVSALQFGGGVIQPIDLSTFGTFTRSTAGTYLTGAPTDGSTAFIASASANVRRIENRGDFGGLLLEGSRTNYRRYSRDPTQWSGEPSGVTTTDNYANGPDGTLTACRTNSASGLNSRSPAGVSVSSPFCVSSWARATSTSANNRLALETGGTYVAQNATLTSTYSRMFVSNNPGFATVYAYFDFADRTAKGYGGALSPTDFISDMFQLEVGAFPSSPIETTTADVTRGADILTATIASAPSWMIDGRWTFDVAPIFSSAEGVVHATDQCLFAYSDTDSERVFFVVSGGAIYIRVTSGGVTKVTSNALTFSAHQKLTVILDGAAGSISVSGATTGNGTVTGTSWTRSVGTTLYVGNRQGAAQPLFARIGRYLNAA